MLDWLTYSLQDFLLFSPDVYWRLLERYLAPLTLYLVFWQGLNVASLYISYLRQNAVIALIPLVLSWLILGGLFYYQQYTQINPYAQHLSYLCVFQALLILINLVFNRHSLNSIKVQKHFVWLISAILVLAPLCVMFFGPDWRLTIVGFTPLPTIIFSGLVLALMSQRLLLILPLSLFIVEFLTLVTIWKS